MRGSPGCSRRRARSSRSRFTCSRISSCASWLAWTGERSGRERRSGLRDCETKGSRPGVNRRRFIGTLGAGLGGVCVRRLPAARAGDLFVERWSWAMGQPVHVMAFATSEAEGLDACSAALAELRRIEARLSRFDDASDLCELNRHAGRGAMRVDRDLLAVLRLAGGFRQASGECFDVAVEPLMRVWGFHRPRTREPAPAEIAEARQ